MKVASYTQRKHVSFSISLEYDLHCEIAKSRVTQKGPLR